MKRMLYILLLLLLVLVTYGCGHRITLMGRETGIIGKGSAPASWGNTGSLTIEFKGKTYKGQWVYTSGGGYGLINAYGLSPGGFSTATGTSFYMSGSGVGNAFLHAGDGSTLRCDFQYSEWSRTGLGVCVNGDGKVYDMQIH